VVTISVRISEKQKADLRKHGRISEAVKEAINLYLSSKRSEQALKKLKELQRTETVKTTAKREVELINEDRRA
jgi:hypothetical protein